MTEQVDDFDDGAAPPRDGGSDVTLVVDVGGFEGPIDLLLTLAREQKLDLTQISILDLADQYLEWVARVRGTNLELAADYLVMAAWLAYLKSRLLLPDLSEDDEPTGEEMAAALAFQLRRLEAMQESGARLMAQPQLGQEFFSRGAPEAFAVVSRSEFEPNLFDLLRAYGDHVGRSEVRTLRINPSELISPDEAIRRMRTMMGSMRDWADIETFLPDGLTSEIVRRSAMASMLAAALQMTKEGKIQIRQGHRFGPIQLRSREAISEVDS